MEHVRGHRLLLRTGCAVDVARNSAQSAHSVIYLNRAAVSVWEVMCHSQLDANEKSSMTDPRWPDDANTSQRLPSLPEHLADGRKLEPRTSVPPGPGWYPNPAVGATQWWDGHRWAQPALPQMTAYGPAAQAPLGYNVASAPVFVCRRT